MRTVNDKTAKVVLASNIRKLLDQRQWSIRELARQTSDPVMTIHDTLTGKSLPRAGVLTRIADAFEVSVDALSRRGGGATNQIGEIMEHIRLTLTPELLRLLDALRSGNRVALVEDLLWSSPRVRAAAKRLGVERRPRPERGKYERRKVDCGGETR